QPFEPTGGAVLGRAVSSGVGSGVAVGGVDEGRPRRACEVPSGTTACGVGRLYWPFEPPWVRCEGPSLPSIAPRRLTSPEPAKTARVELSMGGWSTPEGPPIRALTSST